jgi:hypothetical protein
VVASSQSISEKDVIGEWHRRDRFVVLLLSADHTYEASWAIGVGMTKGTWKVHENRLSFAPPTETSDIVGHLETLRIARHEDKVVLAPGRRPQDVHYWDSLMTFERPTVSRQVERPAPAPVTPAASPDLRQFMAGDFHLVHQTKDIDSSVLALLRRKIGSDPRLAEPDQTFQLSDVVQPGNNAPYRRLVLAGHQQNMWFIKYIRGGFAPYGVFAIFSRTGETWQISFTAFGESEARNIEDIRREIELGKYFPGCDGGYYA